MIEVFKQAMKLPSEWDMATGSNYALRKDNLILLEEVNPCNQTYVLFRSQEESGIVVHYELKLNILSFSTLRLNLPVTVIGVPYSVCEPGYSFKLNQREIISNYIRDLKGAKIILNAGGDVDFPGFAKGYTLPACIIKINWKSFDEYLYSLRSHYRYRYKKALEKAEELSAVVLKDGFNEDYYSLYEQVYRRSQYKLEKLSIDYFYKSENPIIEFKLKNIPVAFVQYTIVDKVMVFLFGGLNYELNKQYDLYTNMLLCLVREAVKNNCIYLNLGQTAEEIKCRVGAFLEEKYLYIHHPNPVLNNIAHMFKDFFSYNMKKTGLTVFKR